MGATKQEKLMQVLIAIVCVAVAVLPFVVVSCVHQPSQKDLEERAIHEHQIYRDGFEDAVYQIDSHVDTLLSRMQVDIMHEYGMHPNDAIELLCLYESGEPVPMDDVHTAILSLWEFYNRSEEILETIDDFEGE